MNDTRNNRRSRPNNRRGGPPRKHRDGNRDGNRPAQQSQASAPQGGQSGQGGNRPTNKKKMGQNKNRRPKNLSPIRIIQKYDNLLDQHLIARKKFFEMHGRLAGKQLEKIEQNFTRTLEELRKFERGLRDWQKEVLEKKINNYPEDRAYSKNHNLSPDGEFVPFAGEFEDPHLLPTQASASFKEDTEESLGSMDDYYAYKGIEPPAKS